MIVESLLAIAMMIAAPKADRTTPGRIVIEQADDKFAGTVSRTFSASMGAPKKSDPADVSLRLWAYGSASSGKKETPTPTDFAVLELLVPKGAAGEMPDAKYNPSFAWGVFADGLATNQFVVQKIRRVKEPTEGLSPVWFECLRYCPSEKRYSTRYAVFSTERAVDTKASDPHVKFYEDGGLAVFGLGMNTEVLAILAACKEVELQVVVRWQPVGPNGERLAEEKRTICTATLLPRQLAQMKDFAKAIAKGK